MQGFFLSKFEFDYQANERWIDAIEAQDVTDHFEIRRQLCHILNVHHLWISRLNDMPVFSDDWDDLPFHSWRKLNRENCAQTQLFIVNKDIAGETEYTDSEGQEQRKTSSDILYHILQHSVHHRAYINFLLRKIGAIPAEMNFIAWSNK
ncbi:hypothetical protein H9Y05_11060 [Crocinitomicaceae bacterium CZZ-1]|uniref:Damage-inducible protein DinB n=1 Tax=Taishania pollutisoli TaxID=2766479 RepID=A0A8J6P707_9FLAO|nr:DinB family protein [Taishania pollutisoli]MBC9813007.1 hypothetical protein [Taishania pollutisoli]